MYAGVYGKEKSTNYSTQNYNCNKLYSVQGPPYYSKQSLIMKILLEEEMEIAGGS